jgi:hypothetical protein
MQCYVYQMMADIYDEIPFDEALQGNIIPHPHFRPGQEVYDSLIVRINDALGKDFDASTNTDPGKQDLLFWDPVTKKSEISHWIQFANTLKLKIYLRQIYARPAVAEAGINALYAGGGNFLTKSASMWQFDDVENKSNPLYEMDRRKLNAKENIKASKSFMDFLTLKNDTLRRALLFTEPKKGFRGIEQGNFGASTVEIAPIDISTAIVNPADTLYFMSMAEVLFMQAEVAARNLGPGTGEAKALYDSGIRAAFDRFKIPAAAKDYSKPTGPYAYPAGDLEENLQAIAMQRWIALAGIEGLEAFFERNRLGYPEFINGGYEAPEYERGDLVYPIGGVTGVGNYPKRLLFPETERNRNPNTPSQVPITTKVWWDKK